MIHNGVELQGMTHNGVEVQTWTHNGVDIYSASKPWIAINSNGALTAPCVKPVSRTGNLTVYWQGSGIGYQPDGFGGVITKNSDGTNYLPTEGCKYIKFRISSNKDFNANNFNLSGKKSDGTVANIGTYNCSGGAEAHSGFVYKDFSNINIKGYDSIALYSRNTDAYSPGIAYIEFYN